MRAAPSEHFTTAGSCEAHAPVALQDSLITLSEVESITGFGKSWIYASVNDGAFPLPVKLGTSTRWSRNEVGKWVSDRLASRALGQPWKQR